MHRPPAPGDEQVDPLAAPAEASAGVDGPRSDLDSATTAPPSVEMAAEAAVETAGEAVAESAAEPRASVEREQGEAWHESEAEAARITEDARRQARELIQAAELEAKGIVVLAGQHRARRENDIERLALEERRMRLAARATAQEAERKAEELLAATEAQCRSLVREAESEAERKATEIVEDAWRRARERLEEAELESKGIVVETGKERARLLNELALERALVEETRTRFESLTVIEEAARKAEELLLAAEQRREELQSESEGEAER
jgi:hypothetical protein